MSRVLLVEDYADAREMYAEFLGLAGYQVSEAADGEQALLLAAASNPDLIVLDIGLPKIDGLEVARRLRKTKAAALVPIIALSASMIVDFEPRAHQAGCTIALSKPCLPDELLAAIRTLLGEKK